MSIPPVHITDAPRAIAKPNKPFRILPSLAGSWREEYFHTQAERDARGQELRDKTGEDVLLEFWDWSNTQDYLNRGWAMDWVIRSSAPVEPLCGCGARHAIHTDEDE